MNLAETPTVIGRQTMTRSRHASTSMDGWIHQAVLTFLPAMVIGWLLCLTPRTLAMEKAPVHLFLLSGQSNMANLDPSLVFIPAVQKHFGAEHVAVVKVAQKSQPIRRWHKKWMVTGDQNPAEIGDLYEKLMQQEKTALAGRPTKSVTLIWMQGERDAKESLSAHYEEAFLGLLEQTKTDLGVQNINYIIGRLSDSGLGNKEWDRIRAIQEKLGEAGPHCAWINTDDLNDDKVARDGSPAKKNDLHYSDHGYRLLAERYANKAKEILSTAHPTAPE